MTAIYRARYSRTVRYAAGVAVIFHALLLILSPPFDFKVYSMEEGPPELIEVQAEIELPKGPPPEPPMPPQRFEAAKGDESEEDELPDYDPEAFFNSTLAPRRTQHDIEFVSWDKMPVQVKLYSPVYPELARQAGIQGTVRIAILIDEAGKVIEARVETSEVTPAMERAAIRAAFKSRFEPARQRDRAVRSWVVVPFEFRLR